MKQHNFGAGPGILPEPVIRKSAEAIINFNNTGLSILEISHRSTVYEAVMENARNLVKEILGVPNDYAVLFLHGGASTQFAMAPANLLRNSACYVDTGIWASKAIKEAKIFGDVNVLATSKDKNYSYIPKGYEIPDSADYLHITSNNTIFGSQMQAFPDSPIPVVCDMSSDIFSRPIDVSKFGLIYAGAQKNMGPAGATLVVVKKDLLGKVNRTIPSMLDYNVHIESESMYNTPPAFAVYVCMLTLEWIKEMGGISKIEQLNNQKAEYFYKSLDLNNRFKGTVEVEDRSRMNACFSLVDESKTEKFDHICLRNGIVGIKGHRLSGGYRASLYNALPFDSVKVLVDAMNDLH